MYSKTYKAKTAPRPHRASAGDRELAQQHCLARARVLDRLADAELQHGHHAAGERLAHQAAEMRGVAR